MKILIAGGRHEADYIVKKFREEKHQLVIINKDLDYSKNLSKEYKVKVYNDDPTMISVLERAGIQGCDMVVALCAKDEDNFVICQIAEKVFNIDKIICTVTNPKNVDLFHELGIKSVVSSAEFLVRTIQSEVNFENVVNSLAFEQDKISMLEIKLDSPNLAIIGKTLMQLENTNLYTIACISRKTQVLIPSSSTEIKLGDKLFVVTSYQDQDAIVKYIRRKASKEES